LDTPLNKMKFKKNKYQILKKVISPELSSFISNYFLLKRKVARTFFDSTYISQFSTEFGVWNDKQVPETYSHYSDIAMETLLQQVKPVMEKHTGIKLSETYSYARIYKKGDILKRHKDRYSCEISTTLNLGGDPWPIYLSPQENVGIPDDKKGITMSSNTKGIKVDLKPGDMLIYKGVELEHWRKPFTGKDCVQVFLHYNSFSKEGKKNLYDGRPHLGLPKYFSSK
tara:strand:- start:2193 stop:2870 length:678 start_codon:yes stop_codon:yes gene_type:complete